MTTVTSQIEERLECLPADGNDVHCDQAISICLENLIKVCGRTGTCSDQDDFLTFFVILEQTNSKTKILKTFSFKKNVKTRKLLSAMWRLQLIS